MHTIFDDRAESRCGDESEIESIEEGKRKKIAKREKRSQEHSFGLLFRYEYTLLDLISVWLIFRNRIFLWTNLNLSN